MQVLCRQGGVMYLHGGVVRSHRPELLWPHFHTGPFACNHFFGNCLESVPRGQIIFCLRGKKGCANGV